MRQFWVPIARTPQLDQSSRAHVFGVVGRLAAGVSAAQARDRLTAATDRTAADAHGAQLAPLREQFVRDARAPLLALAGATLAILLIACAEPRVAARRPRSRRGGASSRCGRRSAPPRAN